MKLRISYVALLVLILSLICASCGSTSGNRVAKKDYAAITLEDGTRGTLWINGRAQAHSLATGDKVFVRSTATDYEAKRSPNMYYLVTNAKNDSTGTLRGNSVHDYSDVSAETRVGSRAYRATIDSLFRM